MNQVTFESDTISHWYEKNRWKKITSDAFINHLNSHVTSRSDEAHQFQLDLVMLESRENQTISITRDHFQSLLQRFEIPESAVEPLFHKDGRYTHWVEYSRVGAEEHMTSLSILMKIPSLEYHLIDQNLPKDSFSLLLRISVQTNSAACIIIAGKPPKPSCAEDTPTEKILTVGGRIAGALQRDCSLITSCPVQVVNILLEELDHITETYRNDCEKIFLKLRDEMVRFCIDPKVVHEKDGMTIFWVIHGMNILRSALVPLHNALEFELSALHYMKPLMEVYQKAQKDGNRSQFSQAMCETFNQKNQYLETTARLRQKRRENLETLARLDIETLRSSNAQHNTSLALSDSIAVKIISFVTLIFLPVSIVATISGSNAFAVENTSVGNGIKVWDYWWILVAIAVALTAAVLGVGLFYWTSCQRSAKRVTDPEHGRKVCPFKIDVNATDC